MSNDRPGRPPKPPRGDAIETGQLVRQRALGTDALYRIVERVKDGFLVEVVDAPGLDAGARFVFSEEAVSAMEVLYAEAKHPHPAAPPKMRRRRLA